jgi:hypothetical protein
MIFPSEMSINGAGAYVLQILHIQLARRQNRAA